MGRWIIFAMLWGELEGVEMFNQTNRLSNTTINDGRDISFEDFSPHASSIPIMI
jgi:hypothetical protein